MPNGHDLADAVRLPPSMDRALAGLIARAAALTADEAKALKTALFGSGPPTFGQVRRITAPDLASATERACSDAAIVALKELAELMPRVDPRTPVCGACGEFPLSNVGGKVFDLPAGAACPFCPKGRIELVPMKLRMVAWTDGHLTEPQTTHDLRVHPGWELPLQDDGILHWADGWMEPMLERALRDAGTSVYALLAFMRLGRKTLVRLEDAADLLHDPKRFGLADGRAMAEAAKSAKAFVEAREVTNVPAKPFIIERLGRDLPRLTVAGRAYLLEGRIGRGDKSDVFRAIWDHQPTERVVLKICRALDDADLMKNEVRVLKAIKASEDPGAYFFTRILPEYVADGTTVGTDGSERHVTVLRDRNLFDWTLADVLDEYYPERIDPQTMVWMWNRVLTLLAWTHRIGFVHGAVLPSHVLLHVQNHAATLLDWSAAVRYRSGQERIAVISDGYDAYYPPEVLSKGRPTPETDIAMSARCMIAVLGGNPADGDLPASVPAPFADILRLHARYGNAGAGKRIDDALALQKVFDKLAVDVYGPKKFHPFEMPRKRK